MGATVGLLGCERGSGFYAEGGGKPPEVSAEGRGHRKRLWSDVVCFTFLKGRCE